MTEHSVSSPVSAGELEESRAEVEEMVREGKLMELDLHLLTYKDKIEQCIVLSRAKGAQQLALRVSEIFRTMINTLPVLSKDDCAGCKILMKDIQDMRAQNLELITENKELVIKSKEQENNQKLLEQRFDGIMDKLGSCANCVNLEKSANEIIQVNKKLENEVNILNLKVELTNQKEADTNKKFDNLMSKTNDILTLVKRQVKSQPKIELKDMKETIPPIIVDTKSQSDVISYRDVLRKNLATVEDKPKDLIVNRNRLIIKMPSRQATENLTNKMKDIPGLSDLGGFKIARDKRIKLILMGVPEELDYGVIIKEIRNDMEADSKHIEVIKDFRGLNQRRYVIISLDPQTGMVLLNKGRVLIDFVRVKVQKYINFVRCFKCQEVGHFASACHEPVKCAVCGKDHETTQCDSSDPICFRCEHDRDHRSDSIKCPVFRKLKSDIINQKHE